jgi:hypothetical protein
MTTKQKTLTLPYYQDPGHGWVRVSVGLLHGLKIAHLITPYSYRRGDHAYLEEDGDLSQLLTAAAAAGITIKLKQHHTNKQSKIRGYSPYLSAAQCAEIAASHEAMIKARIQAQGCSLDFIENRMIIKVIR